jgi:hypothetical protein
MTETPTDSHGLICVGDVQVACQFLGIANASNLSSGLTIAPKLVLPDAEDEEFIDTQNSLLGNPVDGELLGNAETIRESNHLPGDSNPSQASSDADNGIDPFVDKSVIADDG